MMDMKDNRFIGFLIIIITYILAVAVGIAVYQMLPESMSVLFRVFIADVAATVLVYISGLLLNNASMYDPYWSVAPLVILPLLTGQFQNDKPGVILLLIAIFYWGIRLTTNWATTFSNLRKQDWRYDMLKEKSKKAYQLVNFFGINMFPTLIVFFSLIPAIYYIQEGSINWVTVFGFIVCLVATTLQLISDIQMHRFRKKNKDKSKIINIGLWKYSRHPNYLGEIAMWWGIYIMMASTIPDKWYLCIGAVLNTLMFLFISIPMAENRLAQYKANFDQYKEQTRMLFPFKKKPQ